MAAKKVSGPSGAHKAKSIIVYQKRPGQFAEWTAAAKRAGLDRSAWIREVLDAQLTKLKK
jgi:hypothetical protein